MIQQVVDTENVKNLIIPIIVTVTINRELLPHAVLITGIKLIEGLKEIEVKKTYLTFLIVA